MVVITQTQIRDYGDLSVGELFDMIDDLKEEIEKLKEENEDLDLSN